MGPFELVVAIVAMSLGYGLIKEYFKRRERKVDPRALARIEALEERVEVLERILTDRRRELDREFESLNRG